MIGYEYSIRSRACGYVDNFAPAVIVEQSPPLNTTAGGFCRLWKHALLWMKSGCAGGFFHRCSVKLAMGTLKKNPPDMGGIYKIDYRTIEPFIHRVGRLSTD